MLDLSEPCEAALGPLAAALAIVTETNHEMAMAAQAAVVRGDRSGFAIAISQMDKLMRQTAALIAAADVLAWNGPRMGTRRSEET